MKSINGTKYIKNLIQGGEGQQIDFKFEISDAKKVARSFAAFANTDGGKLLIGVKDNGRISGIRTDEEEYMVESAAHIYCKPRVIYNLVKWNIDGRWVLEIDIPRSKKRPHYAPNEDGRWTAYVRVADKNIQANRILETVWKQQGSRKGTFITLGKEEKILIGYLEINKKITFSKFCKIARISHVQAEQLLVSLILMQVIRMVINEKSVSFELIT